MDQSLEVLKSIKRNIFWIDNDIPDNIKQTYVKYLNDNLKDIYKFYKIHTFDSLEKFESYLKNDKELPNFPFVYVIIGESLVDDYFNRYILLKEPNIIAATIVFGKNKNNLYSKPYANDLYLNPGGIVDDFVEVIEYIQKPNLRFLKDINENIDIIPNKEKNNKFGNTFKYAQSLSDITLPIILTEIIKKNLIEDKDIKSFENFIFFKYLNSQFNQRIIPLTKPSLEKDVYIPLKKRAKFLLRLYTHETDFYKEMNRELTKRNDFGPYKAYILISYFSIQNKSLKSFVDDKLYRKSLLSKKEMDNIIKIFELKKHNINQLNEISSVIYYSKPFLSFTKDISKIPDKEKIPGNVRVKFILNPPKYKDKIFFSNIDMENISSVKEEEEVLFLPYSCFEIESYKEIGESEYEVTLNYLDKYYDQIKEKISSMKNENDIKLFYQNVLGTPFSEEVIECLKNYDNIYNNISDIFSNNSPISINRSSSNIVIPEVPHKKLMPRFNENMSMEGKPKGFSNGKQLNALYRSEPVSVQIEKHKISNYTIWEMKYADKTKSIIRKHKRKECNIIIKKINEVGEFGYYDEAFKPTSKEIKIKNVNTNEVLRYSKDFKLEKIKKLSILRNGYSSANIIGHLIGSNLAKIDIFIKSSIKDKIKTICSAIGISTLMYGLSKFAESTMPIISIALSGVFYFYDAISTIINPALTKKEKVISTLKNITNFVVNFGIGLGEFYAGLKIGINFDIISGAGVYLLGLGSGLMGGFSEGLFGRFLNYSKMVLKCKSFYNNYIPIKFMQEGNIPELFWEGVNKNTKSLALEAIIDNRYTIWTVINIPPNTRKISSEIGETLIKYENFQKYNPTVVDYRLYSINKEKITKEEWNSKNKYKDLIIDFDTLEVKDI